MCYRRFYLDKPLNLLGDEASKVARRKPREAGQVFRPEQRPLLLHIIYPWYSILLEAELTQGHSAAGKTELMKKLSDPIGNRSCDLPVCRVVPQPTAPPHTPQRQNASTKFKGDSHSHLAV